MKRLEHNPGCSRKDYLENDGHDFVRSQLFERYPLHWRTVPNVEIWVFFFFIFFFLIVRNSGRWAYRRDIALVLIASCLWEI